MLRVALGFRMHSGWGVMVAVDEKYSIPRRERIELVNGDMPGGKQPYHHARDLGIGKAEEYLAKYLAACKRSALKSVSAAASALARGGDHLVAAGIVLASSRKLPPLPQILAAHPLIHAAEGSLFRNVIRESCESISLPVLAIAERDLLPSAERKFGVALEAIMREIDTSGRSLGPPWDADYKAAVLLAALALREFKRK